MRISDETMTSVVIWGVTWVLLVAAAPSWSEETGLSKADIGAIVDELQRRGLVVAAPGSEALSEKARAEAAVEKLPGVGGAEPEDYRIYWNNGLRIERNDKVHSIKIGGRILNDWAVVSQDNTLGADGTGTEFRRARLYVSGTLYERFFFKGQYDFAGGDADFKDAYLGFKGLPYGASVKIGQFKEPFSLEEMTSSNYITFMERSVSSIFNPSRETGILLHNTMADKRMTVAIGGFRDVNGYGDGFSSAETYDVAARLTGLPVYSEDGRQLLHLGASYVHRFRDRASVQYKQRPEAHLADYLVDTSSIVANHVNLVGMEAALVLGPASVQAEYTRSFVNRSAMTNVDFWGGYVQASVFLTGENRSYDRKKGAFGRVKPKQNFNPSQGTWGAIELAARVSRLDLNDKSVQGGVLSNVTAGINWHLFPNLRAMANYVHGRLKSEGDVDTFQARFQVDF